MLSDPRWFWQLTEHRLTFLKRPVDPGSIQPLLRIESILTISSGEHSIQLAET